MGSRGVLCVIALRARGLCDQEYLEQSFTVDIETTYNMRIQQLGVRSIACP